MKTISMEEVELPIGRRTPFYRLFEILPAILSYITILLPVLLSILNPLVGALFVVIYIIAWFVKAMTMSVRSIQGFTVMRHAEKVDWHSRLLELEKPTESLKNDTQQGTWKDAVHAHNLERLAASRGMQKPSEVFNAVIIATYNEGQGVLEPTIKSLVSSNYDVKGHVILVLAYEERGGMKVEATIRRLQAKYKKDFFKLEIVKHPQGVPNEVVGKGANITHAGKYLAKKINQLGIEPDNVIVTTLDSDNRPHKQYLSYMTYEYIAHPDSKHASFQPLSLYLNNIWHVPAPIRVLAMGNSFWNIIVSLRPNMLRNFASHSQSLAALLDMDFWSVRTVVEDGHQFWRSYFRFGGHYSVVPIHVPIYQDAVMGNKLTRTLYAQFIQLRRWAYGVSDIPYVAERVFTSKRNVPFWDIFPKFIRLFDSHISWASAPFILLLGAFAPIIVNADSRQSMIVHELPSIASMIQQIALVGLVVVIVLSFMMLPERPKAYNWRRTLSMLLQWVLSPFLGIMYSSAASLYAQTLLMSGRYLDHFDFTEKIAVKNN